MKVALGGLGMSRYDFWTCTPTEFWPQYDAKYGHIPKPVLGDELKRMEEALLDGYARGNRT